MSAECEAVGTNIEVEYHPGVWKKSFGKYSCCGQMNIEAKGCTPRDLNRNLVSPYSSSTLVE